MKAVTCVGCLELRGQLDLANEFLSGLLPALARLDGPSKYRAFDIVADHMAALHTVTAPAGAHRDKP